MKLLLNISNNNKEKLIDFILSYNELNKNNNLINELIDNYNVLKNEIDILKKEIQKYKENNNENFKNFNPEEIQYPINLTYNSFSHDVLDNTFTAFNSIENILYLIYCNDSSSIIAYNLKNDKIIKKIKKVYKSGDLDSSCFLTENSVNYIITCNDEEDISKSENIKVYDFLGNKIKEINNSNDISFFIDSYYDKIFYKNYIITSNDGYMKSYDFSQNKIYRKYCDQDKRGHFSFLINIEDGIIKIIESVCDGNIRIWDFNSGILLNRIKVSDHRIYGICLWNDNYLFVGCEDKKIKLIDLKIGRIINELTGHSKDVLTIKTINHPKYGKCLISQGWEDDQIRLWINSESYSIYLSK